MTLSDGWVNEAEIRVGLEVRVMVDDVDTLAAVITSYVYICCCKNEK